MQTWLWLSILACVSLASASSQAPSSVDHGPLRLSDTRYDRDIRASVSRWWTGPEWQWWKAQLYQESRLDPQAVSPAGATGLAQFMPGTWADMQRRLGIDRVPPTHARHAIDAGAYYMAVLQKQWSAPRPAMDRHFLAMASYNAGLGNVLKAQEICEGAVLYEKIVPCLADATGSHSVETIQYVRRVRKWRSLMR